MPGRPFGVPDVFDPVPVCGAMHRITRVYSPSIPGRPGSLSSHIGRISLPTTWWGIGSSARVITSGSSVHRSARYRMQCIG